MYASFHDGIQNLYQKLIDAVFCNLTVFSYNLLNYKIES
jgi:hypothetical protein